MICRTPECSDDAVEGKKWCAPCQRRLDRIAGELAREREDRSHRAYQASRRRKLEAATGGASDDLDL